MREVLKAKTSGRKHRGSAATSDTIVARSYSDPAKALVINYIGQLVADGFAEWELLQNGDVRFRAGTGETFVLGETAIVRLS